MMYGIVYWLAFMAHPTITCKPIGSMTPTTSYSWYRDASGRPQTYQKSPISFRGLYICDDKTIRTRDGEVYSPPEPYRPIARTTDYVMNQLAEQERYLEPLNKCAIIYGPEGKEMQRTGAFENPEDTMLQGLKLLEKIQVVYPPAVMKIVDHCGMR